MERGKMVIFASSAGHKIRGSPFQSLIRGHTNNRTRREKPSSWMSPYRWILETLHAWAGSHSLHTAEDSPFLSIGSDYHTPGDETCPYNTHRDS